MSAPGIAKVSSEKNGDHDGMIRDYNAPLSAKKIKHGGIADRVSDSEARMQSTDVVLRLVTEKRHRKRRRQSTNVLLW